LQLQKVCVDHVDSGLIAIESLRYTVKKDSDLPVPSRDVANQILSIILGQGEFG
jgi:hypothetical protein